MRRQVVKNAECVDYILYKNWYCYLKNNKKIKRRLRRMLNKSYRKQLKNELIKEVTEYEKYNQ